MIPETFFMHFYELKVHEGWQRFQHNPTLINTPNLTKLEDVLTGPSAGLRKGTRTRSPRGGPPVALSADIHEQQDCGAARRGRRP